MECRADMTGNSRVDMSKTSYHTLCFFLFSLVHVYFHDSLKIQRYAQIKTKLKNHGRTVQSIKLT